MLFDLCMGDWGFPESRLLARFPLARCWFPEYAADYTRSYMQAQNTIEADAAKLQARRAALGERAVAAEEITNGAASPGAVPAIAVPGNAGTETREGGVGPEFLTNLAHQLRSPLSSLRVLVDLLSDPAALASPDSMKRLVDGIDRATTRLERQITDVLEAGYLEAGTLTVETAQVNAAEQIVLAVSDTEQAASSRRVSIELKLGDQPAIVIAEATRLRQLIGLILSNAIKFAPVGSAVKVTAGSRPRLGPQTGVNLNGNSSTTTVIEPQFEGHAHYICVSDTGPGIDPVLHHEVFKP
ncbi:MAG: HAMP domain-containing sensor histidine kinase, partial [Chloroflexi bacterium]|nr:HAMP domain-containing sensor histidine kinase [Chloroflexota bacterium]